MESDEGKRSAPSCMAHLKSATRVLRDISLPWTSDSGDPFTEHCEDDTYHMN